MSYVNNMSSIIYMSHLNYMSYISYMIYVNYMSIFMNQLKSNILFSQYIMMNLSHQKHKK